MTYQAVAGPNRRWTVAEIGIALDDSLTHKQAAHLTGRTLGAVRYMRRKLNQQFRTSPSE